MRGLLIAAVAMSGVGGVVLGGGAAHAQNNDGRCFDKGTLTYVDCPGQAPAEPRQVFAPPPPAPVAPPVVDDSGFYVGARGGLTWPTDTDFGDNLGAGGITIDNEYDMGYAIGGLAGYDFGQVTPGLGIRTEIEVGYQAAEVDSHEIGGATLAGSTGDTDVLYGFLNAYGDIGVLPRLDLVLGGGVGLGQVAFDGHGGTGAANRMDDEDIAFGYHLDAGLAYDLAPNVTAEAMYRYSSFIGAELTSAGGVSTDVDVNSHQGLIGLRFKF